MAHEWHLFDEELGAEVRRVDDGYEYRHINDPESVVHMTVEEFARLRELHEHTPPIIGDI